MMGIFHGLCLLVLLLLTVDVNSEDKFRSAKQNGDIIIGTLFSIHRPPDDKKRFTRECGEIWEQYGIHRTEQFFRIIDAINNDPDILPNVTLGYDVRDSCWYSPIALDQSIDFIKNSIASMDKGNQSDGCNQVQRDKPIAGLIGPASSQNTIQVQNMLQMFHIPQVGFSATSLDLSNKNLYKYFVRVVPSDKYQAQAMLSIVLRYKWKYINTVHSEGNYGERGIETFRTQAKDAGVCIAASESAPNDENPAIFDRIIEEFMKIPRARVIVCFCEGMTARRLMAAMKRHQKARGYYQLVASDGWADRPDVVDGIEDAAVGALTIRLMSQPIETFNTYFMSLNPENNTRNPWFREFWQWKFNCRVPSWPPEDQDSKQNATCNGTETIQKVQQDAKLGFVVKAVYALAYALHNMHKNVCRDEPGVCDGLLPIDGNALLDYLREVNFTFATQSVYFDESGDPPPRYDIVNYQRYSKDGRPAYRYRVVGSWKSHNILINESMVVWPDLNNGTVTRSICSDECARGQVMKQTGNTPCCWICQKCADNEILANPRTCLPCKLGYWPNENLTKCNPITIEHINWHDTEAMVSLIISCIGIFATIWICYVFIRHNNTPIVKASTRELMYIILIGVLMAFCSNFFLVARPSLVTCYFNRILPGMSFSLVYGPIVTKTNRIARILEGTKKIITKKPRFMSASAQVIITCLLICVECAIITIMLVVEPADSKLDYPAPRRVRLVCNTTTLGIIVPLGFDLVLIIMCTLYAVKTRNLPENFNEAKFIGFSMYTTCVIWLGFMAIYFGSERKVITMSVSISLSAYVALVLLFLPKVYIIIWAPSKNTRSAFTTTSKDVRCHIGSISCASGESMDLMRDKKTLFSRDKKSLAGLIVLSKRRASFMQRLRYGGTLSRRPPLNPPVPRIQKDPPTTSMKREDSFHVPAPSGNDTKTAFSWSTKGVSEDDQTSVVGSKECLEEVKGKHVTFKKKDFGCQTDSELLKSILTMPYLRRRQSQRIQRSKAIDEDYTAVKFSPNSSMKVRYNSRRTSNTSSESGHLGEYRKRRMPACVQQAVREKDRKTFLFPGGYSDSPLSTSDDIENEDDFEYYDSISDLLKAHSTTPICVNDAAMSTYLNPLGNRANSDSLENDTDTTVISNNQTTSSSLSEQQHSVQLVVENGVDGPNTIVVKETRPNQIGKKLSNNYNSASSCDSTRSLSFDQSLTNTLSVNEDTFKDLAKIRTSLSDDCLQNSKRVQKYTSITNAINPKSLGKETSNGFLQNTFTPKKQTSPVSPHFSSQSLNINDEAGEHASALSKVAKCSKKTDTSLSADNISRERGTRSVEEEKKSMLEFQIFLRERGVNLDISQVESSDV